MPLTIETWLKTSEAESVSMERIVVKKRPATMIPTLHSSYSGMREPILLNYWKILRGAGTAIGISSGIPLDRWARGRMSWKRTTVPQLKIYFNGNFGRVKFPSTATSLQPSERCSFGADTWQSGGEIQRGIDEFAYRIAPLRRLDVTTEFTREFRAHLQRIYTVGSVGKER